MQTRYTEYYYRAPEKKKARVTIVDLVTLTIMIGTAWMLWSVLHG